jgi:hypothetical protein
MRGDPDACEGWAYNWESAECSTSQPTARDGHATMFLICNHTDDPLHDFQDFASKLSQHDLRGDKQILVTVGSSVDMKKVVSVTSKLTGALLLRGSVTLNKAREGLQGDVNSEYADHNIGYYAQLEATTVEGMLLMRLMETRAPHGYCCVIDHDRVEFDLGDGLTLIKVSGLGPDDTYSTSSVRSSNSNSSSNNNNRSKKNELATRFTIQENGIDVARCHLSYRDGSYDPSMGPTIEMMATHKDHRDRECNNNPKISLLPILWYWVICFIQENCTLECMNNDTIPGNIMVKATHLTSAEVERKNGEPVTDKDFFYDYAGFSVREQKGCMGALMRARRPKDEEAVLFIPLLSKQHIRERTEYTGSKNIKWPSVKGARCCDQCGKVQIGHLRCGRCKIASYCTKTCQKQDWRRHKKWCGKTKDQVHEVLVEQGHRVRQLDGTYATARGTAGMRAGLGPLGGGRNEMPFDISGLLNSINSIH